MATQTKESPKRTEPQKTSGVKQVAQKVGYIEREEIEIDGEGDRRYHRSQPAIAKTDVLVGNDDVNGLKQDPGNDQTGQDANDGKDEAIAWNLIEWRGLQNGLHKRRDRGCKDHQRDENDEEQKHNQRHNVLGNDGSLARMVNERKIAFDGNEKT